MRDGSNAADSFAEGSLLRSLVAVTAWFVTVWISAYVGFSLTLEVHMEAHAERCMGMLAEAWAWWSR